jgi:hypothetical protein
MLTMQQLKLHSNLNALLQKSCHKRIIQESGEFSQFSQRFKLSESRRGGFVSSLPSRRVRQCTELRLREFRRMPRGCVWFASASRS